MSTETLILGDCLEKLREIEDGGVDAIVTDPPYELGFMGKSWDSTGIANSVEMWKECLRVLKPGGYLLSFSATRTYHRMACAIEDAGFEVRDMIEWIYSTGFPKSHNVFKQLKKECTCGNMEAYEQGTKTLSKHDLRPVQESDISKEITNRKTDGEVLQSGVSEQGTHIEGQEAVAVLQFSEGGEKSSVERGTDLQKTEGQLQGSDLPKMSTGVSANGEERRIHNATQVSDGTTSEQIINENRSGASHRPQSEQQQDREPCAFCKQWGTQATRTLGVGSALKPAHEPICVARKPLEKGLTIATNVLKYGTGGINIDESRVETSDKYSYPNGAGGNSFSVGEEPDGKRTEPVESNSLGRFPANLIHDNSEEVRECFPETKSQAGVKNLPTSNIYGGNSLLKSKTLGTGEITGFSDSDNASRFFKSIEQVVDFDVFSIYNRSILTNIKQLCGQHLTKKKTGIMLDGVILEVEKFIQDAELLMSGNSTMEKFLTDIVSTTKTLTAQMTELKTLNVLPNWLITKFTEESEKTIKSLKELNTEDVKSAKSIFLLQTFISEVLESIRAIAEIVAEQDSNNGDYKSLIYQAKASKSERDKGCEELEEKEGIRTNAPRENEDIKTPTRANNHPTVKPIALMEYLINMVSREGAVILDPFMGSGTTGVACRESKRNFIGIEKDETYFKIASERINNAQLPLL